MEKTQNTTKNTAMKKRKKVLRTPSHILRLCIVWSFVICIFLLSSSFVTETFYINDKLEVSYYLNNGDFTYSTLEEIKSAEAELQKSIDNLEKKADAESNADNASNNSITVGSANFKWVYNVAEGIKVEDVKNAISLIDEAMAIDRNIYTDESVEVLNKATSKMQRALGATVTISQSALQIMLGGDISEMYGKENVMGSISNSLFIYTIAIIPVAGFLVASFDKKRHIKHIISIFGSALAIIGIMLVIYPSVDIGSVLTIIMYIIISILTVFSIYAKQQEDYIVNHPELEAEYSDKHPQFVKALINKKAFGTVPTIDKKEQERIAAQNAKKKRNKKK